MEIFGTAGTSMVAWGPTASVEVKVEALGDVVNDSWVLTGANIGAKEIVDIRQCFNDVSYIYALGNDQSKSVLSLSFIIFLGRKNCQGENDNYQAIEKGINSYRDKRISKNTSAESITIGGFSCKGWIVGIDIGQHNPSNATCSGTLSFIMQLEKK